MIYVADTHSLVWFLSEDQQLSLKAKEIFEQAEKGDVVIIIPTIVLAELLHIYERKGKQDSFSPIIKKLKEGSNYTTYDLDIEVILACKTLIKIPEMHDKIITATAKLLKATVITKDQEIIDAKYVETVW